MKQTYDPIEFIGNIELFTVAVIGSFITLKFLNAMYENIYEPTVDVLVDSGEADKYYLRVGKYYIQIGSIIKEFIKWFLLIILLMIVWNIWRKKTRD